MLSDKYIFVCAKSVRVLCAGIARVKWPSERVKNAWTIWNTNTWIHLLAKLPYVCAWSFHLKRIINWLPEEKACAHRRHVHRSLHHIIHYMPFAIASKIARNRISLVCTKYATHVHKELRERKKAKITEHYLLGRSSKSMPVDQSVLGQTHTRKNQH